MGKVIHKIELPKLLPGEQFSYEILRDGDGEIEGVRMKLEGHELRIEEIVDIEQIYCAHGLKTSPRNYAKVKSG